MKRLRVLVGHSSGWRHNCSDTRKSEVGDKLCKPFQWIFSKSSYCVLLAAKGLLNTSVGKFSLLVCQSHGLHQFAGRTSAERQKLRATSWFNQRGLHLDCVGSVVADAKDVFEKGTATHHRMVRKSPWHGSEVFSPSRMCNFVGPHLQLLNSEAETKDMNADHTWEILMKGEWSD